MTKLTCTAILDNTGNTLLHAGWALLGQGCDCTGPGSGIHFNRFASWLGDYASEPVYGDPVGLRARLRCAVGDKLVAWGTAMTGPGEVSPYDYD